MMYIDRFVSKDTIDVFLLDSDIELAKDAARRRQENAVNKGIPDRYGFKGNGLKIHEIGCISELAVARWLNSDWVDFSTSFKELTSDVGNLQVRATDFEYGRLFVHPKDNDDQPYVLVRTHKLPVVKLIGWMMGVEAKRKEWWQELRKGRPCFIVPNNQLRPMEELIHVRV